MVDLEKRLRDQADALRKAELFPGQNGAALLIEAAEQLAALKRQPAAAEPVNEWKEAVIDACVVANIGWDENDPRKSLQQLISWEVQIALDPMVSSAAQALIDRGQREAQADLRAFGLKVGYEIGGWVDAGDAQPDVEKIVDGLLAAQQTTQSQSPPEDEWPAAVKS